MNNEIKGILRTLKAKSTRYEYCLKENISYNDESYEAHILLDFITNLQQENERLKEENKHIFANVNDDELLISNAMNYAEAQNYKSRCEKAIEYIENQTSLFDKCYFSGFKDLLNILQNGSEN